MKQIKLIIAAFALLFIGSLSANAQKIGYVDGEALVSLLPETKIVQEKINKYTQDTVAVEYNKMLKEYQEKDLILANENYISLDHHSSFDSRYAHKSLDKINQNIEEANQFLQSTNFVIITFGTSYIYEFLPQNRLVANCHKIPQKFFEKRFLSHHELTDSINKTIEILKDICKDDVQILFTVSPVRHTKDGIVENQLSKSKLITAIHESISGKETCHYLPIYELMMDDLRDYRFYKEDMIHPNSQAVQYIWEKFGNAYFADETKVFINENNKILTALNHKTNDEKHPKYQEFLDKINQKMIEQQKKVKHKIFLE